MPSLLRPASDRQSFLSRFRALSQLSIRYGLHNTPVWNVHLLPAPRTRGNCTVALCWSLGIPIHVPLVHRAASGPEWLNSDGLIKSIALKLYGFEAVDFPEPGDFGVFGWSGQNPGHAWMISRADPARRAILEVIDCSPANGSNDSIRSHPPTGRMTRGAITYGRFRPRSA